MSSKTFIFVTRFFYPACTGIPRLVTELAVELAGQNHQVKVLTSQQGYENIHQQMPKKERFLNIHITRISALPFKRKSLIGRIINYLIFFISCFFRLFSIQRNDIVIILSEPPLLSTFILPVIKLRGGKIINWIQDIHPEISANLGLSFAKGISGNFLKKFRNIAWNKAQANIVLSNKMAEIVKNQGIVPQLTKVYPNWEDGTLIQPLPNSESRLRKDWKLTNKFIIGYSGNLGRAHDFHTVLRAATELARDPNFQDIVFLFIGDGFFKKKLEEAILEFNLNNIILKNFQPREQLCESLNVPNVHLISALPSMEGLLVPGKLTSALAVGKPILFIGNNNGEVAEIIHTTNCGKAINIGDSETLKNIILKLKNDAALSIEWGRNARKVFEARFDKSVAMSKLCNFLINFN